jgi:hypothetical protein
LPPSQRHTNRFSLSTPWKTPARSATQHAQLIVISEPSDAAFGALSLARVTLAFSAAAVKKTGLPTTGMSLAGSACAKA